MRVLVVLLALSLAGPALANKGRGKVINTIHKHMTTPQDGWLAVTDRRGRKQFGDTIRKGVRAASPQTLRVLERIVEVGREGMYVSGTPSSLSVYSTGVKQGVVFEKKGSRVTTRLEDVW